MNLKVNKDACVGCGTCYNICDAVFDIADDGLAYVKENENLDDFEEDINSAIDACPTGAISND